MPLYRDDRPTLLHRIDILEKQNAQLHTLQEHDDRLRTHLAQQKKAITSLRQKLTQSKKKLGELRHREERMLRDLAAIRKAHRERQLPPPLWAEILTGFPLFFVGLLAGYLIASI